MFASCGHLQLQFAHRQLRSSPSEMKLICLALFSSLLTFAYAGYISLPSPAADLHPSHVEDDDADTHYEFQYSVHDGHTGDVKDQFEHRRGGYVTGRYSLIDADGLHRIVEYSADPLLGFQADVRREVPQIRKAQESDETAEGEHHWPSRH